ncbi:hypothetical protein SAMN02745227_01646 [Anaerobranca californiensis DSM 14826]|jgi:uncharacterized protein YlxP (DUF503 family)|uniref:DUF503 domain-containing protein n=1 Tax=Anaerobranca californiensis DSM 14826 TaxID=1120989 RepID=A0A1M6Q4K9_9FIRM|nr:DUF503 family protein [Anaerobranca californiensis]SHK15189.1 hypothetical protein SAMN02745227_01646 [Anaerobranca californiensis DSM 14826]
MKILYIELTIHIFECDNLKRKRNIANSMAAKLKNKFNVSVAQKHDKLLNSFILGLAMVSTEYKLLIKHKEIILNFLEQLEYPIEIVEIHSEII